MPPIHHNLVKANLAPDPITPNPNCLETCTSNKNQHLGQLHNTYVIKSHTKEEMVEAHCLEAKMKANKAVDEERWAAKGKESITYIVEYEEKLG